MVVVGVEGILARERGSILTPEGSSVAVHGIHVLRINALVSTSPLDARDK